MNADRISIINALAIQKAQYAADLQSVAIVIRYVGAQASGTVEINAAGELLFKHGALGAEAADTTVSTDGTIAVAGAAENTFGEVVDVINSSANWNAKLVGALRGDSSNNTLVQQAATQAKRDYGAAFYFDDAAAIPISLNISAMAWERQKGADGNPWSPDESDYINSLIFWRQVNTFAAGTSEMLVYEVDRATNRETLLWRENTGATTVITTRDFSTIGNGWGICASKGCELVVRMLGDTHLVGNLMVIGASRKFGY